MLYFQNISDSYGQTYEVVIGQTQGGVHQTAQVCIIVSGIRVVWRMLGPAIDPYMSAYVSCIFNARYLEKR